MNAASQVFHIPELLELILISLPCDTTHSEIASMRTILTSRTTTSIWHSLLQDSPTLRRKLYILTAQDVDDAPRWLQQSAFPPAEPNPWIPHLLLNQRSWGSAWPFEHITTSALFEGMSPSKPKFWTFSLELSRAQYSRLPPPGAWRMLLAASPPFTDLWCTRAFYELGSGRAPFVTHIDYNAKVPKSNQKYRVHRPEGVTLGDLVDSFGYLFELHSNAKFVMIESITVEEAERPTTKSWIPGSSAEKAHGWERR